MLDDHLGEAVPRQTAMGKSFKFVWLPMLLLFSILAALPVVLAFHDALRNKALTDHGVHEEAVITGKHVSPGKHTAHVLEYRFDPSDRAAYGEANVGRDYYEGIVVGDRVPIVRDATTGYSMLDADSYVSSGNAYKRPLNEGLILIGIIVCPVACLVMFVSFTYRRQKRLLQWGRVAPAVIDGEEEYSVKGGTYSRVHYSFVDALGLPRSGTRNGLPRAGDKGAEKIALRARIFNKPKVLFDEGNGGRHDLYPLSLVELRAPSR